MTIANVSAGEVVDPAWGNDVADEINGLIAAWTGYTPTLTQSGAVTKTVTTARYIQQGKVVHVTIRLDITGSGTSSNAVTVGLPVAAASTNGIQGTGNIVDASAPQRYTAFCAGVSTTTFVFATDTASTSAWGVSPTTALASGDILYAQLTYEAA